MALLNRPPADFLLTDDRAPANARHFMPRVVNKASCSYTTIFPSLSLFLLIAVQTHTAGDLLSRVFNTTHFCYWGLPLSRASYSCCVCARSTRVRTTPSMARLLVQPPTLLRVDDAFLLLRRRRRRRWRPYALSALPPVHSPIGLAPLSLRQTGGRERERGRGVRAAAPEEDREGQDKVS